MDNKFIVELIGYLGSALVLLSFLMTSVVRLRVVSILGSVVCIIYSMIIKAYPTLVMNVCLVIINAYFLYKGFRTDKEYDLLKVDANDALAQYLLDAYQEDMKTIFPERSFAYTDEESCFVVFNQKKPVGLTVCRTEGDLLHVKLDYSIPEYRDYSVGKYLYEQLKKMGYRKAIYEGSKRNHVKYLEKTGFVDHNGVYEKDL